MVVAHTCSATFVHPLHAHKCHHGADTMVPTDSVDACVAIRDDDADAVRVGKRTAIHERLRRARVASQTPSRQQHYDTLRRV